MFGEKMKKKSQCKLSIYFEIYYFNPIFVCTYLHQMSFRVFFQPCVANHMILKIVDRFRGNKNLSTRNNFSEFFGKQWISVKKQQYLWYDIKFGQSDIPDLRYHFYLGKALDGVGRSDQHFTLDFLQRIQEVI